MQVYYRETVNDLVNLLKNDEEFSEVTDFDKLRMRAELKERFKKRQAWDPNNDNAK